MDDIAQILGFKDLAELDRLTEEVDLSTPTRRTDFKVWQATDGTKSGLLELFY